MIAERTEFVLEVRALVFKQEEIPDDVTEASSISSFLFLVHRADLVLT